MAVLTRLGAGWALAVLLLIRPLAGQSSPPARVAQSLVRLFGKAATADTIRVDSVLVLRVHDPAGVAGYAIVRNVRGKDQPITFLVAVDTVGALRDLDILVYREPYGGEVAYDAWRRQFRGKTAADSVELGQNIRSISGATISANSVTLGVRHALEDFARWAQEGRLR